MNKTYMTHQDILLEESEKQVYHDAIDVSSDTSPWIRVLGESASDTFNAWNLWFDHANV